MLIIDVVMCQFNQIGWMYNCCCMIVVFYLVKDLICDWCWGECVFMEFEVDGDLVVNNGGWQWSVSSGMDFKFLCIFNFVIQVFKFDLVGDYICQWVLEFCYVNIKDLLSGEIGVLEWCDYFEFLVDYKKQQVWFKVFYVIFWF